jgi:hypothetical protein
MRLLQKRFQNGGTSNGLEDLKALAQTGSVDEYMQQFERLKSKLLLEGGNSQEWILLALSLVVLTLKGDIRPFVKAFKPVTLEEAYEYALHMEKATDLVQEVKEWLQTEFFLRSESFKRE